MTKKQLERIITFANAATPEATIFALTIECPYGNIPCSIEMVESLKSRDISSRYEFIQKMPVSQKNYIINEHCRCSYKLSL